MHYAKSQKFARIFYAELVTLVLIAVASYLAGTGSALGLNSWSYYAATLLFILVFQYVYYKNRGSFVKNGLKTAFGSLIAILFLVILWMSRSDLYVLHFSALAHGSLIPAVVFALLMSGLHALANIVLLLGD